jgi:uncharacterized Fe-S cluster-containing protein
MSMSNTTKRVKEIRRKTRRKFSSEEKIRIVLDGLRGECVVDVKSEELDTRIILHDLHNQKISYVDDAEDLKDFLDQDDYIEAMHALGQTPVVNI